jgi:hypothetical protein
MLKNETIGFLMVELVMERFLAGRSQVCAFNIFCFQNGVVLQDCHPELKDR